MYKTCFEWYIPKNKNSYVSIAKYGITFSNSAIDMMGNPEYIMIGYDGKNKIVAIKTCSKDERKGMRLNKLGKNINIRLANRGLMRYLIREGVKIENKAKKYNIKYDKEQKIFYLNLKERR